MSVSSAQSDPSPFSSESNSRCEPYRRQIEMLVTPSLISRIPRTKPVRSCSEIAEFLALNTHDLLRLRIYYYR